MSRELTLKQSNFCDGYISLGNASEAYRQAYNAGGMKAETVHRKAAELLENGKVTARIEKLRSELQEAQKVTHESQVAEYRKLKSKAEVEIDDACKRINTINRIMARIDKISGLEVRKEQELVKEFTVQYIHPEDANL